MRSTAFRLWVLTGPTATGKTDVAQDVAERWGAAIVSADSMLVYRGMDIGTAKPPLATRRGVPYLGIDLMDPDEPFDVYQYVQIVRRQLAQLPEKTPAILVGGSGLYVRALLTGLSEHLVGASPQRAAWTQLWEQDGVAGLQAALRRLSPRTLDSLADAQNPRRLIRALEQVSAGGPVAAAEASRKALLGPVAGLWVEPSHLNERIAQRVKNMYAAGLLDEARQLLDLRQGLSATARQAIGYAEAIACIEGHMTQAEAMEKTVQRTRRLAKRQRTWFRHQQQTEWVTVADGEPVASIAGRVEAVWREHGSIRIA